MLASKFSIFYFPHANSAQLLCTIAKIPYPIREWRNNIVLIALWHSPIQPPMHLFFRNVVHQLRQPEKTRLSVDLGEKDK